MEEVYRTIRLVASHANDALPPVRLSADDHDGRFVLFELWDGGEAVQPSGLSAKMLYTTADGVGGYTNLVTTTSNGTAAFTGPFPSDMLGMRIGALALAVSDGDGTVTTLRVPFYVDEEIIDEDSPEAQDALSEFRAAVEQLDKLLPATTTRLGTIKVGGGLSAAGDGTLSVDETDEGFPVVPIAKGGTGQTVDKAAQHAMTSSAEEQTAAATDDTYILAAHTSASAENGFIAKRKLSNLWAYIAGKIRSVFGFSSANVLPVSNGGTGATESESALTNLGAFPVVGGTVTGNIFLKSSVIDRDDSVPTANQIGNIVQFRDKDGERLGQVEIDRLKSGMTQLRIGAFSESGGTEDQTWLNLQSDPDGDLDCITTGKTVIFFKTTDASGTADNRPALIIGNPTGEHLELDNNEIMCKSDATHPRQLVINQDGGMVYFGGGIQNKSSNFTIGTDSGNVAGIGQIQFLDSNSKMFGNIRLYNFTGGRQVLQVFAQSASGLFNTLMLGFNADGSRYVGVTAVEPWLNALGLNTTKSSASSQITMASGFTLVNVYTAKAGAVLTFRFGFKPNAAMTASTAYDIATLASGLRPYGDSYMCQPGRSGDSCWVTTGGVIRYRPGVATAANTALIVSATYVVA